MNVQFKGLNPMQALQQKKAAQQKQAQQKAQQPALQQLNQDTFGKKDPKFGASCCG